MGRVALVVAVVLTAVVSARVSRELNATQSSSPTRSALTVRHNPQTGTVSVFKSGTRTPILVEHAGAQTRPYIRPITAPDGAVVTGTGGLFWAFTDLNGRDYFHNSDRAYWRRMSVDVTQ